MDLSDLLLPELVAVDVSAATRKAPFTHIGALAAPVLSADARVITDALAAREKLGSTAFGGGVAIPHARLTALDRIVAGAIRLAQPIDFGAVDDVPVDLMFVLFSPPNAGADHLKALARVARLVRNRTLIAKLRGAGSRDAIWALLTTDETRDAA
ncbi:PTS sugar transporter subunit IIA [Sphingomonas sp. Mn802worker]|uniref:PTS sugar transporter subunit IIA n=1 Tax=Sphingomonas sp. Mn802worker TaxID=629773 RepID=UPI00037FD4FE|nr:PTS sugar transporter subunit IIA [Sphingomonas sp. Mn802worker]